jgi:hypothetical protein
MSILMLTIFLFLVVALAAFVINGDFDGPEER